MMSSKPLNRSDLFWSYSRWQVFNKCERAYCWQYLDKRVESQGSAAECRKLMKLDFLVDNIVIDSIRAVFSHKKYLLPAKQVQSFLFQNAHRLYRQRIINERHVFELFYDEFGGDAERFLEHGYEKMFGLLEPFVNSASFDRMKQVAYLDFKFLPTPVHMFCHDVKVWMSPMLIWRAADCMHFLAVGRVDREAANNMQVALNAMLAEANFAVKRPAMRFAVYDLTTAEQSAWKMVDDDQLQQCRELILGSTQEMYQKLCDKGCDPDRYKKSAACTECEASGGYIDCKFKALCY